MLRYAALCLGLLPLSATPPDPRLAEIRALLEPLRKVDPSQSRTRGATPVSAKVKHLLRDYVESKLSGFTPSASADSLQRGLAADIRSAGLTCQDSPRPGEVKCAQFSELGFLGGITVQRQEQFLIVTTTVGLSECGLDDSAYIYEWAENRWVRALAAERNEYSPGSYAPEAILAVQVSPTQWETGSHRPRPGHVVAVLGVDSWCVSMWHFVSCRVWSVPGRGSEPKLMLNESELAYLGRYDPPARASVTEREVLLEYTVGSWDVGVHSRQEVRRYRVDADALTRIDPVALSPRDFVDEWAKHSPSEMARWTESKGRAALDALRRKPRPSLVEFLSPTLHCRQPDLWQVGVDYGGDSADGPNRYFLVRWRPPYSFTMVNVSGKPFPGCTEPDPAVDEQRTLFADWH